MDIKLINVSIHDIDIENNNVQRRIIDGQIIKKEGLLFYTKKVITDIYTPPDRQSNIRGQYYKFSNEDELVPHYLKLINQNPNVWEELTEKIAVKLFSIEVMVNDKVVNLKGLRKGSLLQAHFTYNNEPKIALIKIDTNQFLSEVLDIQAGLPINTRVQKVAITTFNSSNAITSLLLSDTNSKITEYWRYTFLQSEPVNKNKQNTKNAFVAIDNFLKKKIKPISKQDYYFLRNKVILDFRKDSFEFNNLVSDLQNYEPVSNELGLEFNSLLLNFQELPKSAKSFDTQFDIDTTEVKAKLQNKMVIDDNFDLIIKRDIDNLRTVLGVGNDDDGGKYVKIYSEVGYSLLKTDSKYNDTK